MGGKYEKLVFEFPAEHNEIVATGDDPGYIISPQAYFRGASQIPGSRYNVGFQLFVKPFFLDRVPHRHEEDEYLIFLGGSLPNVFEFEASIELDIGQAGVDAETFYITRPTIVRIPAGVPHCPLNFKRIDKPVFFQAALMQPMFSGIYDMEDGQREMWYNGPNPCVFNPDKKCEACRGCIDKDWR